MTTLSRVRQAGDSTTPRVERVVEKLQHRWGCRHWKTAEKRMLSLPDQLGDVVDVMCEQPDRLELYIARVMDRLAGIRITREKENLEISLLEADTTEDLKRGMLRHFPTRARKIEYYRALMRQAGSSYALARQIKAELDAEESHGGQVVQSGAVLPQPDDVVGVLRGRA